MPGDPASRNDDELLSQIDELKARMDRLMRGGTSTSNSALLTDAPKPKQAEAAGEPPTSDAEPDRTRVRDLIGAEDTEVIEIYPGPKEAVPFPEGERRDAPADAASVEERAEAEPQKPVDGSVIKLPADEPDPRTPVARFDQLGNAIQQELARDTSVPPVEAKKGPDLASRFGPAEEVAKPEAVEPPEVDHVDEPVVTDEYEADSDSDSDSEFEFPSYEPQSRRGLSLVAVIWLVTAIASGALATLHFVGMI